MVPVFLGDVVTIIYGPYARNKCIRSVIVQRRDRRRDDFSGDVLLGKGFQKCS